MSDMDMDAAWEEWFERNYDPDNGGAPVLPDVIGVELEVVTIDGIPVGVIVHLGIIE